MRAGWLRKELSPIDGRLLCARLPFLSRLIQILLVKRILPTDGYKDDLDSVLTSQ
jgi:hypothetical protein